MAQDNTVYNYDVLGRPENQVTMGTHPHTHYGHTHYGHTPTMGTCTTATHHPDSVHVAHMKGSTSLYN